MDRFSKKTWCGWLAAGFLEANLILALATPGAAQQAATIRNLKVLNQGNNFELEIDSSQPVTPKILVVTGPDRLVIDFPRAVPGRGLRPLILKTSQVKGVRMGLFASSPPVARVVLDLNGPQPYEVFPSGNKVIVKLVSGKAQAAQAPVQGATLQAAAVAPAAPPPPPEPHAEISLQGGKLSIRSDRATLVDILREVQRRIGASLSIPPGSGQEAVITQLGPAPVREVLSKLLDGSNYNVVLVGSGHDWSGVTSIILTAKGAEGESMPANFAASTVDQSAAEPQPEPPLPDPPPPTMDNQPDASQSAPPEAPPPPDAVPPPPQ